MRPERWGRDFPMDWTEDDEVNRRQFIGFLTLVSGGLFLATALLGVHQWWRRRWPRPAAAVRVAALEEVPVGGAKSFSYPTKDDQCLLIRLGPDRFVAYNQSCTHLTCPVTYRPRAATLYCPCHEGRFSVEDGRSLSGPPKRPLRGIALIVRDGALWATGNVRG